MGITNNIKFKRVAKELNYKFYDKERDIFRDYGVDLKNEIAKNKAIQNDVVLQSRKKWINLLTKEDYQTLVTIQKPMRNKYSMDGNIRQFFNLSRVWKLFYSVEPNKEWNGYHIHLMFDAYRCNRERMAFALDLDPSDITYYKRVRSRSAVSTYVTKHMGADQINYNFYSK